MTRVKFFTPLVILSLPYSSQIFVHVDNCPTNNQSWTERSSTFVCEDQQEVYHCIRDSEENLIETCMKPYTIISSLVGCPWVKIHSRKSYLGIPLKPCDPLYRGCPENPHEEYTTDKLFIYPTCITSGIKHTAHSNISVTERPTETITRLAPDCSITQSILIVSVCLNMISLAFWMYKCVRRKRKKKSIQREDIKRINVNGKKQSKVNGGHSYKEETPLLSIIYEDAIIPVLSDKNRPTKLGERFYDLYDNQWIDAMDLLEEKFNMTDTEAIQRLLAIVQAIYQECDRLASNQPNGISKNVELSEEKQKMGIDNGFSNSMAPETLQRVAEVVNSECISIYFGDVASLCQTFIESSIELCCNMRFRDPPITLTFSAEKGEQFDGDIYRPYREHGSRIDFLVWPVMYLHTGGPILKKGVVQLQ